MNRNAIIVVVSFMLSVVGGYNLTLVQDSFHAKSSFDVVLTHPFKPIIPQVSSQKYVSSDNGKRTNVSVIQEIMPSFTENAAFRRSENEKYSGFINHNICGLTYLCVVEKTYYTKYPDQINYNVNFSTKNCNFLI